MLFCSKCGAQLKNDAKFCHVCGAEADAPKSSSVEEAFKNFNNTDDTTESYDRQDIEANRVLSVIAYLSILFIVPMLAAPNSRFARFHTNQGLVLFVASVALSIALSTLGNVIGLFGGVLSAVTDIAFDLIRLVPIAFAIIGIINAAQGRAKELPIIGKLRILN